ncbi:hypothetical protein Aph01nite_74080 [Acrocarpospora phusangensis]|uniref:Uncharacterized protein n=1 Tax=Acrocarpospora phusangensis TaxID=1070424 RepID=A0A919QK10_9ACTN|nr:hypothetical protein [Acrocarpospora phusangensis]GIH29098.1 hypothetical protein Aph01nite_74080 [Acrocarpospora phusangensis]
MTDPIISAEMSFPAGAAIGTIMTLDDPARGKLDTATLAAPEVWVDVTPWLRSFKIKRGVSRATSPILRYEPGKASLVLDNRDRRFDPENLDGPYVAAGITQVTPMRAVRIRATWDGITYDLFRGYIDDWDITWEDPDSQAVALCTDAFKVLAKADREALLSPVGAGEMSGARIHRILDGIDWPATDRIIGVGNVTVQETSLGGKALEELQLTSDSDIGELYIDGAGRVVFRGRFASVLEDRSNLPQGVFGDLPGELPYKYDGLKNRYSDEQLVNLARIGRVGGTVQVVQDAASIERFLEQPYEKTNLIMESDSDALGYAAWIVSISRDPELHFDSMIIEPPHSPDLLYPHALGREIGDRITVIRRPPGGGDPIERDVWIRGMEHEWKPKDWRTTWAFQSASKTVHLLVLDDPDLGQLDNTALA